MTGGTPILGAMRVTLCALLLALVLGGCGTSDDQEQARNAVIRFYRAIEEHRGGEACAQLSAATISQLESQSGQRCARAVTDLKVQGGGVSRTQVFVTNAKVDIAGGQSAFLSREPEGWKLSAVGCKPEEGRPRDRPLDCEVEA
jgi:hypothetical protein